MQKSIIYCRVSSRRQSSEGHGLESQEHRCREYAKQKGYEIEKVFSDSFTGAGDFMERPAMTSLLNFLDKNITTNYVIIFDDLKRLSRDITFYLKLRREFNARNATVECPNFTFENTPEGQFIEGMMALTGELERKQNQRQVIQKHKARLEKGYWAFTSPRGYSMSRDPIHGQLLKKKEPYASIIKEALEGFASGRFENQIDVQKFLQLNNYRRYVSLDTVKRILTNPLYAGYIEYKDWDVTRRVGHHEPLITSDTFMRIENKLNGKVKVAYRKDNTSEFPLRGFILCSVCNKPMTASWSTGRNGKHPYYHCKTKTCDAVGKSIKRELLETGFKNILRSITPNEKVLNLTKEILLDTWKKRLSKIDEVQNETEKSLDEIRVKIRNILDRISKTTNETLVNTYENELSKLTSSEHDMENHIKYMQSTKPDFGTALDMTFSFLKNPNVVWEKDDLKSKHLVLKLVFNDKLTYDRTDGFRTASLALPLRVFELKQLNDSSKVDPTGLEPATPSLQMMCSTR